MVRFRKSSEVYKSYIKDIDMNKMKLALLVAGSLVAGASTSALAADETQGTVTFTGKVITETCKITSPADQTVPLDAISIKTLANNTDEAGFKTFFIDVNCPAVHNEFSDVGIHFEPVGKTTAWDSITHNLKNAFDPSAAGNAGKIAATNVQVKIYNTNGGVNEHAKIGQVSKFLTPDAQGDAKFTYAGGYYATGQSTPGEVFARVQYTLVYQ